MIQVGRSRFLDETCLDPPPGLPKRRMQTAAPTISTWAVKWQWKRVTVHS